MRRRTLCKRWILIAAAVVLCILCGPFTNNGDLGKLWLEYGPRSCSGLSDAKGTLIDEMEDSDETNKKILLWTYMWSYRSWLQPLGQETFLKCPEQRCELITDRCLQPVADALLFYFPSLWANTLPRDHPPWQIWALATFESEMTYYKPYEGSVSDLDGKINWTISHRFDSEIFMPYFYFLKITSGGKSLQPIVPPTAPDLSLTAEARYVLNNYNAESTQKLFTKPAVPNKNYAQSKPNFVLWYVSNCRTKGAFKRARLFRELRKYIPIDVFSRGSSCKDLDAKEDPCNYKSACAEKFMSSYKFYLSFENSECNYYITEKFYRPLQVGTLPVAFGAPLRHYEAVAPENSFLYVRNFTSVKHLADFMTYLHENDDAYNSYFKWKEHHVSPIAVGAESDYFCKLCEDLWDVNKPPHTYHKFSKWWNHRENCNLNDTAVSR